MSGAGAGVVSVGGLLPRDLLERVTAGDGSLPGMDPTDYGLVPGERLTDAITRSWNRLQGVWEALRRAETTLPDSDATATAVTRDRWLRPLLDELGFAGLPVAGGLSLDGKDYPISHQWGGTVPVHLPGVRVPIDRVSRGVPGAARTSPHGLVQEFLNRSESHLWGIVSNGLLLRILRNNASLTRQAYVEFDLESMFDSEAYSDFVLLWLCCHRSRFEGEPAEKCLLEQWMSEAASTGTRALDKLREGVEAAINSLGQGFVAHSANVDLRKALRSGELSAEELQRQLLRLVYRLLFLLVAESRDLLLDPKADQTARQRYHSFYSMERLRTLAARRRGSPHDDLWASLEVTMTALGSRGAPAIGIAPLGSFLWSPEAIAALAGSRIDNRHLLAAVRHLCWVRDDEAKVDRLVDYRSLGAEELGSVYESLLELHAWVDVDARSFETETVAGSERKTTGSYYTPTSLIQVMLDSALDPVLDEAERATDPESALLALKVLDPATGSGHFLIAAAHRIAGRLASIRADGGEPAPEDLRRALRDVIARCIYGIDVNPMAVELCKVSLWMEAQEPGRPLSFLDHRIVCGNSLLGATPALIEAGAPDEAFKPLLEDDKNWASTLKKTNKRERTHRNQGMLDFGSLVAKDAATLADRLADIDALGEDSIDAISAKETRFAELQASDAAERAKLAADAWCAAFVAPKTKDTPILTDVVVRTCASSPQQVSADVRKVIDDMAQQYRFVHPHVAFPDVFTVPDNPDDADNELYGWNGGFDLMVGNPPFISPLVVSGARVTRERQLAKFVRGSLGGPKADESSYFLMSGRLFLHGRGRLGLVLPDSFLSSSDAAPIREAIAARYDLAMIWRGDGSEFDANVTTIMVSLAPSGSTDQPLRLIGSTFDKVDGMVPPWRGGSWSALVAQAVEAALLHWTGPAVGDLCSVLADYRDQYYGLRGAVYDSPADDVSAATDPPLVTTGLIDPLVCLWGRQSTKYDKVRFERPKVNMSALDPRMHRWAKSRLVPKLLVATQGRMLEVVIDHDGAWLPCVPVISILPSDQGELDLNGLAAILLSPATFELLRVTKLGSGLSTSVIKVSAADIRSIPAPPDLQAVRAAGGLLSNLPDPDVRAEFRSTMNRAYGLPADAGQGWADVVSEYMGKHQPPDLVAVDRQQS